MSKATKLARALVATACGLALVGWVVSLGGVGKGNKICEDNAKQLGGNTSVCGRLLQYEWWAVWFTFATALVILLLAACNALMGWEGALQAIMAVNASVVMWSTWRTLNMRAQAIDDKAAGVPNASQTKAATDTALAGFIISSIALLLNIIFLSVRHAIEVRKASRRDSDDESSDGGTAPEQQTQQQQLQMQQMQQQMQQAPNRMGSPGVGPGMPGGPRPAPAGWRPQDGGFAPYPQGPPDQEQGLKQPPPPMPGAMYPPPPALQMQYQQPYQPQQPPPQAPQGFAQYPEQQQPAPMPPGPPGAYRPNQADDNVAHGDA